MCPAARMAPMSEIVRDPNQEFSCPRCGRPVTYKGRQETGVVLRTRPSGGVDRTPGQPDGGRQAARGDGRSPPAAAQRVGTNPTSTHRGRADREPVSYTHLTLPTKRI